MSKKLMFSMLLVAVAVGGFSLVGVSTIHASSGYGYSTPVCGYGGCQGYNYSVAMYPYVTPNFVTVPAPSYAYITGCGEAGCNSGWGSTVPQYFNPPVYYNPTPVYPQYQNYYGW